MHLRILLPWILFSVHCSVLYGAEIPFTMDRAFQSAVEKNEKVQQSAEQVTQADERISRLKGGLFPDLSFNAVHLIQPLPKDPIAREFSPAQQTTANLTLSQPIFRGLREFAGIRQQKQVLATQQAMGKLTLQRLYQDVAVNYFNVLTLEQDLKNLKEQVEIYEQRVQELRGRTKRGESTTSEYLSTQSTQNSLQAERRLVEGQVKMARESLHTLTGNDRDAELVDPAFSLVVSDLKDYLAQIEERPDIQAAAAQRDGTYEGLSIAKGAHLPVLDAVGNYYLKRPGFLKDLKWDVSFRLVFPLFQGGVVQSQVREAASKNKEAELEVVRLCRVAEEEIRSLHESLRARVEHLSFLRQSSELAEKNISISQKEFRRGLIRSIDVQQALGEYRIIRRTLDQAHFAAQLDFLKLQLASGKKIYGSF